MLPNLTGVVVNYQTPDLLETAIESFRQFYPTVKLLIVDNGSQDSSVEMIKSAVDKDENADALFHSTNLFHGPAMNSAMSVVESEFVYFFDSDTVTRAGGFLEEMVSLLQTSDAYGVGRVHHVNTRGFPKENGIPILISYYMMWRTSTYRTLPPFNHHGLPVLGNCVAAQQQGHRLISYPVEEYVEHVGRGTASRFGYGLGWRSRLDQLLHRLGF